MRGINAIIFDLGGVIINLNQQLTFSAFEKIGGTEEKLHAKPEVFTNYEKGKISTSRFLSELTLQLNEGVSEAEIINAWNAMLLDVPAHRLQLIRQLSARYRLFVLSNTNELHIAEFEKIFNREHPAENWYGLFEKVYYSHQVGYRKPEPQIFEHVLQEQRLDVGRTLFIDDTEMHVNAARKLGIKSILASEGIDTWLVRELEKFEATGESF